MSATLTPLQLAEQAGGFIASAMNDVLLNAPDQARAVTAIHSALNECFNPDDEKIISAVAGGFSVVIVNVMERGFQAIKAEGAKP